MDSPSTPPLSPPQSPTNTLILAPLTPAFFHASVLTPLREHFALHGELHTWAPVRVLSRVIIVFREEEAAESARSHLDGVVVGNDEYVPPFDGSCIAKRLPRASIY